MNVQGDTLEMEPKMRSPFILGQTVQEAAVEQNTQNTHKYLQEIERDY